MLKLERQNLILNEIMTHNKVLSSDLSELLNVSEDTVRRDLKELADAGHIKKVHGGAMATPHIPIINNNNPVVNPAIRKIAEKAACLIKSNQVILIDGDGINISVIDLISKDLPLTIFTNSMQVGLKLFQFPHIETIFLGGKISSKYKVTSGMDVVSSLQEVHADICLMETAGIHEDIGITESDRDCAFTKKAMFAAVKQVHALCMSKDLGTIQPFKVADTSQLSSVITELEPDDSKLLRFNNKGVVLI